MEIKCKICKKRPDEILEYIEMTNDEQEYFDSPEDFVKKKKELITQKLDYSIAQVVILKLECQTGLHNLFI